MKIELKVRTAETVVTYFRATRDAEIQRYLPQKAQSEEEALADFEKTRREGAASYGRTIYVDGRHVGDVWCYCIQKDEPNAMVSYCVFDKTLWNRGVATQSLRLFLKEIIEKFHLKHIGAFTYLENTASIRVLKANGFQCVEEFTENGAVSVYLQRNEERAYYEAYDDRYKQVHSEAIQWFSAQPSPIVAEVISEFSLAPTAKILEIGCGEGRDASHLLAQGRDVLATDVSGEAVAYCQKLFPDHREHFKVLNCITESLDERFDFIYAVAVIHMLVLDEDRNAFYQFISHHLKPGGIALIGTMGDGSFERQSDISTAFDLQERMHEASGKKLKIAGTSCRVVNFATFSEELERNGLAIAKQGVTAVEPDFPHMMYAVVRKCNKN